jgi:hypothetical protein
MQRQSIARFTLFVSFLALILTSCSKPKEVDTAPKPLAAPAAAAANNEVCALLSSEDIEAVQKEGVKDTKPSEKSAAGLSVAQCYFELPTASNSIVLTVTRKAEGGRDPSESWKDMFHRESPREKKEEGEEKEKEAQKIEGLGDEAFWTGTRVGGALFVLKGNVYLRISVGGAGDQAEKIAKSKTLAGIALKRL